MEFVLRMWFRNAMVWSKTLATYYEWMTTDDWANRDIVEIPRTQKDIFKASPDSSREVVLPM